MKRRLLALLALGALLPAVAWGPSPAFIAVWGSRGYDPGEFEHPAGVAIDASGAVFVADMAASRVQILTRDGAFVTQYGSPITDTLRAPSKVAFGGEGTVYVADGGACGISMWKHGAYPGWFDGCGTTPGRWIYSWGVAVAGGRVYVSDSKNYRIQVFTLTGEYLAQ